MLIEVSLSHVEISLFLALDCKQKKSRSRSGSKKKMLPLPHSADEVYILRCRYTGLFSLEEHILKSLLILVIGRFKIVSCKCVCD